MLKATQGARGERLRSAFLLWGPVLFWMGIIFFVSSQNTWTVGTGPPAYQALRKVGHIVEFAILALLVGRALAGTWAPSGTRITVAMLQKVWQVGVLICALYAVSDEVHQAFVPRREFHLTDIAIDVLSSTAALGIWYIVRKRRIAARRGGAVSR